MNKFNLAIAFVIGLLLSTSFTFAATNDWPQFGGANRDGHSKETGLLSAWPEGGPELEWTAEGTGTGYSSLAIVGERIFTIGDIGDEQFLIGLNKGDGALLWKTRIGNANKTNYPGSRSTPTVFDERVYALSTEGLLVCASADDGKIVWQQDLVKDFGGQLMQAMGRFDWQFSESPLVDQQRVIVTPGAKDSVMVAFNCKTGDPIWKTELPGSVGELGADGAGYCSIVAAEIHGTRQYIQLYGRGVMSVDAESGKYLWGYNRVANNVANISSAVVSGNQVFVSTGYQTGSALLDIKRDGENWTADEMYFLNSRKFQNHHGGFVLHEGHIYGGHGHKLGFPICIQLDKGEIAWGPTRNRGQGSASVAIADGHVYMRYENGLMVLVEASTEEYREKGSFMIPDVRAKSWSRPVISGKKLYLKEQDKLHCYNIAG